MRPLELTDQQDDALHRLERAHDVYREAMRQRDNAMVECLRRDVPMNLIHEAVAGS